MFDSNDGAGSVRIETRMFKLGSVVSAALATVVLGYLLAVSLQLGSTSRQFPVVVLTLGLGASTALLGKEILVQYWKPNLLASSNSKVMENLTGSQSQFSLPVRLKRLLIMGGWTGVFLLIASVDLLTATGVAYAGATYSLGVRDKKRIVGGTLLLLAFIYVIFILVIQMPIDMFEVV
jgi:hypothetical protein